MNYDWGRGFAGGAAGAASGAGAGPWGMGIGAALGMLGGFGGQEAGMEKMDTMTKEQQSLLKQMQSMLGPNGQLGQGYGKSLDLMNQYMDPSSEAVSQFAQPHMDQFNQQTIPGLAERFAGAGGMGGAMSSSGFGQSLGSAGGALQNQLAQLKAGLGQQAANSLMGQYNSMSGSVLGAQPFMYGRRQAEPGFAGGYAQAGFPGMQQGGQGLADMWSNYGPLMGNV